MTNGSIMNSHMPAVTHTPVASGKIQLEHCCIPEPQPATALCQGTGDGGHIMFPLKALLAQARLSGLSGEKLLSLYFNLLSGPKTDQARRPHCGMLHYILASPECCHFSEQMPIKRV